MFPDMIHRLIVKAMVGLDFSLDETFNTPEISAILLWYYKDERTSFYKLLCVKAGRMIHLSYTEISLRIICSFCLLLLLTRVMGKEEISQLNVFTFVTAITIGNIAASLSVDKNLKITTGIFVLFSWAGLTILMEYFSLKSKTARKLILGEPTVLIRQGKIMEDALKRNRLDFDTLRGMLRQQNVFSLKDIEYAIFEIDGSLSVMKKQDIKPTNKWKKAVLFPTSTGLVSEGEINEDALSELNLEVKWLKEQLKKAGVHSVSDVFYAELQPDGSLYIDYKADQI